MLKFLFREHAWTEVNRLHHASRRHNSKQSVKIGLIWDISSIQRNSERLGTIHFKLDSLFRYASDVWEQCCTAEGIEGGGGVKLTNKFHITVWPSTDREQSRFVLMSRFPYHFTTWVRIFYYSADSDPESSYACATTSHPWFFHFVITGNVLFCFSSSIIAGFDVINTTLRSTMAL